MPSSAQALADAFGDGMELLEMEEDAGGVDHVELAADLAGDFMVEELIERGDAALRWPDARSSSTIRRPARRSRSPGNA